jgi:hypothetical protein
MIKLHWSKENPKIGNIPNISLEPVASCPNNEWCFQKELGLKCYAMKSFVQYPATRIAWRENFQLAQNDLNSFESQLVNKLSRTCKKFFRIHVAGDFFNQEYLDMWKDTARQFKHINFLAFTKSFHLDYSHKPRNLKIVWSVMPNMPTLPKACKGSRAYCGPIEQRRKKERIMICPGHCESCGMCWNLKGSESAHFDIH